MASRNAQGRMIYWKISYCKQLAKCSTFAQLLFTWGIPNTDDLGRMEGDPEIIKGTMFPYNKRVTEKLVKTALIELHDEKLITWYQVNQNWYIQYPNFYKYQKLRADRTHNSDCPPPPDEINPDMTSLDNDIPSHTEGKGSRREVEEEVEGKGREEGTARVPYDEIKILFNQHCTKLSCVQKITESRKEKLRIRWVDIGGAEGFENLFKKVNQTPFLYGENKKGWKASFDWLIENDRNYLKVIEGNYDNKNAEEEWH